MTDKYTRTFADFGNYPWPGKILPQYFEHSDYSDGYRGTQGMLHHIISAYGAYHMVEGASPTIDGDEWTGSAGYGMFSGAVKEVNGASGVLDDEGEFLIYNDDGTWATTGDKPTGIILARNVKGTVYTANRRQDDNSKEYFPNDVYHYGDVNTYTGILGHGDIISGYESVSADSGIFQHIEGFSDIEMGDSLDFGGSYHLKGVSQLTGAIISGAQITGTAVYSKDFNGGYTELSGSQITGTYGTYDELTGTSGSIGDAQITTTNLLPIGTVLMYNGAALGGNLATRTEQIGDHVSDTITMPGWYVCNGESGSPDLMDKFIICSGAVGEEGGEDANTLAENQIPTHSVGNQSASHDHVVNGGSHQHSLNNADAGGGVRGLWYGTYNSKSSVDADGGHTHSVGNQSASHTHTYTNASQQTVENRPSFYSLVFITRVS